jgi:lysozyme
MESMPDEPDEAARSPRRRTGSLIGVAAVAVLAGLASGWWFLWVPNWRPPLREGERYGIDVSAHQDAIDWNRVARDGITFVYIKATEGGDFTDQRFEENWPGAGEAGLDRGAYHFFTLCTPGANQARHFLDVAHPDRAALAPAVDLELAGNCSARPSAAEINDHLHDFLGLVEEAWGREVVLYVGDDFERLYPVRDRLDRPLWHRRFLLRPNVDGWLIWQLHGYAHVEGIVGGVDLNVMRASS